VTFFIATAFFPGSSLSLCQQERKDIYEAKAPLFARYLKQEV